MLVISLGVFLIGLDNSILFTALPVLQEQLHTTDSQGLWIINAYGLLMSSLLLGSGTLGDRIGHRLMFLSGLALFGVASLAAAYAANPWLLVGARALLGIGAAAMMPATLALIAVTFPDLRERNTAIGIWGSVFVVGAVSGPIIGGLLLEFFWWGSVFLINVPVVLLAIVATIATAPANMPNPGKAWDFQASGYLFLLVGGLVVTIEQSASPHRNLIALTLGICCFVLGALLFRHRNRALPEPLIDITLFHHPVFLGGVLAALVSQMMLSGTQLITSQRFQIVAGYSPLEAGWLSVALALSSFPASIIAGRMLDRVGARTLVLGGFLLLSAGLAASAQAFHLSHMGFFLTGLAVTGLGAGVIMSVASISIVGTAPVTRAGMASAIEEVSYEFGALMAVALVGSLFTLLFNLYSPAVSHSLHPSAENAKPALDRAYLHLLTGLSLLGFATTGVLSALFPRRS